MKRAAAWAALGGFGLYQAIGLGLALSHPEIFIAVYETTLAAIRAGQ